MIAQKHSTIANKARWQRRAPGHTQHLACNGFAVCLLGLTALAILPVLPVLAAVEQLAQQYTVRRGDTLYSLARRYGVAVSQIMRANNLQSSSELRPGTVLQIPAKPGGAAVSSSAESKLQHHLVARGETLYAIARKYAMSVAQLRKLNDLSSDAVLRQGQKLVVRTAKTQPASRKREAVRVGSGSYFWPVSGRRESMGQKLEGVRILAVDHSLVYAVRSGRVVWQGPYRSYGAVALVASSDGYVYLYGGNLHFLVNIGQEVRKGVPIAQVEAAVANQLAGQSNIYRGVNRQLASANGYPSQVYFSVFRNGEFVPVERAPRS